MAAISVFLLSASTLSFEVLLTRHFLVAQHHHLQFVVLSIALLGTGAGGTWMNLLGRRTRALSEPSRFFARLPLFAAALPAATLGSYLIVNAVPFDYFRIALMPADFLRLLLAFFLFSIPFLLGGAASALAYAAFPERSGIISIASFSGSAAGVLLPALSLPILGMAGSLVLAACLPLPLTFAGSGKTAWIGRAAALAVLLAAGGLFAFGQARLLETEPSSYKSLPEFLARAGSVRLSSAESMLGRIDIAAGPSLRSAPGLSLLYTGPMPEAKAVFVDAAASTLLYGTGAEEEFDFAGHTLPFAGWAAAGRVERALVVSRGGGSALASALSAGPGKILLLDETPARAELLKKHYTSRRLTVTSESARSVLASRPADFDIIILEHWGASLPGLESLSEDYLFTVEAFQDCLTSLSPDGLLVVSRQLLLPPAGVQRLVATALAALRAAAPDNRADPAAHLCVVSGLNVYTLIVSRSPLGADRLARIRAFVDREGFDFVYYQDMPEAEANQNFVFPEPYYHRAVVSTVDIFSGRAQTEGDPPYSAAPTFDDKPFFSQFIRWDRAEEYDRMTGGRPYLFAVSGEIAAACVVLAALCLCLLIIVPPLALKSRENRQGGLPVLAFFLFLGAGYMWIEMAFISHGALLFAQPAASFLIVLLALFVFSGAGGLVSQKINPARLPVVCLAVFASAALYAACSGPLLHALLPLPFAGRLIVLVLCLAPLGFLMGVPFPLCLRGFLGDPGKRTLAWAVNGSASVLAAAAETLIVQAAGIRAVLFLAGGCYLLAGTVGWFAWRTRNARPVSAD